MQDLEWRMYGLVPYNISDIQKGIQFGHAVQEFNNKMLRDHRITYSPEVEFLVSAFETWAKRDKTFIILNGGTTNDGLEKPDSLGGEPEEMVFKGSLNKHLTTLKKNFIPTAEFWEPDLGDQLTAVVFIVDERVWNKEKYPDFVSQNGLLNAAIQDPMYDQWVAKIGGDKNLFLRDFLSKFKLA